MILDEKIEIIKKKLKKPTLNHYKDKGYDLSNDTFIVDIKDLHKNSLTEILVKCDFCGIEKYCVFSKYNSNISNGGKYSCSISCGKEKAKQTCLKIYGVDNPSKAKVIKDKVRQTNIDKFGVDSYSKTDEYKNRVKQTSLEIYGVDNAAKSNEIKEKVKQTNIKKFGVDNPFKSEVVKNKIKEINLIKWGVDNYTKTDEYKEKSKQTSLEKWGVEYYTQTDEYKERNKQISLERWGTDYHMKSELFRVGRYKISSDPHYIKYLSNGDSLLNCDQGINHQFIINNRNYVSRIGKYPLCTICYPISKYSSLLEIELLNYIKSIYDDEIIHTYRDGLEIDILLPKLNLGFEFNGLYWHSDNYVDKNYHINKTNYFKDKKIRIIHIWEDDWVNKKDIIKSRILNLIGGTENRLYARECEIKEVLKDDYKNFLTDNHTKGYIKSKIKIGLYHNNELVSLMAFDEYDGKKMELGGWNLNVFCNKINTIVVGGASKLFNYFTTNNSPKRIVSYVDLDWSLGVFLHKLNFTLIKQCKPNYTFNVNHKRINNKKLDTYNKIWDCGQLKFQLIIQ